MRYCGVLYYTVLHCAVLPCRAPRARPNHPRPLLCLSLQIFSGRLQGLSVSRLPLHSLPLCVPPPLCPPSPSLRAPPLLRRCACGVPGSPQLSKETVEFWKKGFNAENAKKLENAGFIQFMKGGEGAQTSLESFVTPLGAPVSVLALLTVHHWVAPCCPCSPLGTGKGSPPSPLLGLLPFLPPCCCTSISLLPLALVCHWRGVRAGRGVPRQQPRDVQAAAQGSAEWGGGCVPFLPGAHQPATHQREPHPTPRAHSLGVPRAHLHALFPLHSGCTLVCAGCPSLL